MLNKHIISVFSVLSLLSINSTAYGDPDQIYQTCTDQVNPRLLSFKLCHDKKTPNTVFTSFGNVELGASANFNLDSSNSIIHSVNMIYKEFEWHYLNDNTAGMSPKNLSDLDGKVSTKHPGYAGTVKCSASVDTKGSCKDFIGAQISADEFRSIIDQANIKAAIAEEEKLLNEEIINPMTRRFSDKDSLSDLESLELIELQKKHGKIKSTDELESRRVQAVTELLRKYGRSHLEKISQTTSSCAGEEEKLLDSSTFLATDLYSGWRNKAVTCTFYARMAITIFAFNRMIHFAQKTPFPFKEAVIISSKVTTPPTGDHDFVLVEGNSETMFAVDLWKRRVVKLNNVTKLSNIANSKELTPYPNAMSLNILFSVLYEDEVYYDEAYVSESTKWNLNRGISQAIEKYVYTYDPHSIKNKTPTMGSLYNYLRLEFFPNWRLEYDALPFSSFSKTKSETVKDQKLEFKD